MKVEKNTFVTQNNKQFKYSHIQNNSQDICFMFSGAGYTYDKPLFYYSTMIMLENNYDVIHIHYSYSQNELNLPKVEFTKLIVEDVDSLVREVVYNGKYREKVFLGKSLGTIPIISRYANDSIYSKSKLIILTPLLKYDLFYKGLLESSNKILLVIGKEDAYYIPEKIKIIAEKPNFKINEIADANHSLDIEPIATTISIGVLKEIITSMNNFLSN